MMAIWGVPAFALVGAARLLYSVLDKKGWLPAKAYRQKAIGRLKANDLAGAEFFCRLALKRNPLDAGSLIVEDLLAMRRDALQTHLRNRLVAEIEHRTRLDHTLDEYRRQYHHRVGVLKRWQVMPHAGAAFWLVLTGGAIVWLPVSPVWTAGVGIVGLIFSYWAVVHGAQAKRVGEQEAKLVSLNCEIAVLEHQLRVQRGKIEKIQAELNVRAIKSVAAPTAAPVVG